MEEKSSGGRVRLISATRRCGTSYRLVLQEKEKHYLQGWAIVENTTDEDWRDVSLSLVSGRPISFIMDLYRPIHVPRPLPAGAERLISYAIDLDTEVAVSSRSAYRFFVEVPAGGSEELPAARERQIDRTVMLSDIDDGQILRPP